MSRMLWKTVMLRDVCELVQYGYTASASTEPIGPKFLRITDIVPPMIDWNSVPYCAVDGSKKRQFLLRDGDIVVARTGATTGYAKLIRNPPDAVFASYLVRLRTGKDVDASFLGSIIQSDDYKRFIMANVGGAAQPNANAKVLTSYPLRVPPLPVQRRIAAILSAYDDLIENNTRRIAILEEMARRLYEEWFVHFRFPGHEHLRMVESDLGPIPEGWQVVALGAACSKITDGAHHSPKTVSRGRPMASVKDMHEWGIHVEACRHIGEDDFSALVRMGCQPRRGEILIAKDGAKLNKHTFVFDQEDQVVLLSSIAILRPRPDVSPDFLCQQLKHPTVSRRIKASATGAAIPRIVLRDFARLPIILPLEETRNQWDHVAHPLLALCRILARANTNLRTQRDLLLPKLISGEIDVSEVRTPEADAEAA